MNWYKIFYWLTVADNFKIFFVTMVVIFTAVTAASTLVFFVGRNEDFTCPKDGVSERAKKWVWYCAPFAILFWVLYLFTPSKSDTLLIIAGGSVGNFITSDSSSKAIPSDISNFLHLKLRSEIADMNDDVKKQLDVQTPKEKLIDKVKDLTKEQLIEYLKNDTTVIK